MDDGTRVKMGWRVSKCGGERGWWQRVKERQRPLQHTHSRPCLALYAAETITFHTNFYTLALVSDTYVHGQSVKRFSAESQHEINHEEWFFGRKMKLGKSECLRTIHQPAIDSRRYWPNIQLTHGHFGVIPT